ncbi:MAG: energy transducer TonB [Candidatus Cloacimonadota bacterium]|nr:MAG: energy transducer TonB [Candidatus Cloacimonadota bacterium]
MRLTLGFYERSLFFNLAFSIVFHSLLFFLIIHRQSTAPLERLESVEFIDETLPPSTVKAPRTISPLQALKNIFTREEDLPSLNEDVSEMLKSLPPVPGVDEIKGIDLSSKDIDRSQAAIDLEAYDDFEGAEGGMTDIIRVGTSQKSTDEILSAPPILIKDKGGPKRGQLGLYTSPGGSGLESPLELESEPVAKFDDRPVVAPITASKDDGMKIKDGGRKSGPSVSITGPLSGRKILAKYLPPYPEWAEKKGVSAIVQIRFWVTPDGKVKRNAFIERTSGSGSWDNSAKKALVKWRFAPLPANVVQETQWGVITIRFVL